MKLIIYGGSDTQRREYLTKLATEHNLNLIDSENFMRTHSLVGSNLLVLNADKVTFDKVQKYNGNLAIVAASLGEIDWQLAKALQKVKVGEEIYSSGLFKFLDKLLTETNYQELLEESKRYPFGQMLRWLLRLTFRLDSDETFQILESVDKLEYKVDDSMLRSALVLLFPKRYQHFKAKWQVVETDLVAKGIIEKIRYTFRDARRLAPQIYRLVKVLAKSDHGEELVRVLNLTPDEVNYLGIVRKPEEKKLLPKAQLSDFF